VGWPWKFTPGHEVCAPLEELPDRVNARSMNRNNNTQRRNPRETKRKFLDQITRLYFEVSLFSPKPERDQYNNSTKETEISVDIIATGMNIPVLHLIMWSIKSKSGWTLSTGAILLGSWRLGFFPAQRADSWHIDSVESDPDYLR